MRDLSRSAPSPVLRIHAATCGDPLPPEVLDALVHDDDEGVRYAVAGSGHPLTEEQRRHLGPELAALVRVARPLASSSASS